MTWFKVDDNFWSHPKVLFQSAEATGLWTRAGSWCANHLTDGRIPRRVTHHLLPSRRAKVDATAEELESLGLWVLDPNTDEWIFHDWDHYQPTRASVEHEREKMRERQRRWRERRDE